MTQSLRVCYFGTYRSNYSRNQVMIEGLRRCGVDVIECHEQFSHGIEDRVRLASGGLYRPSFWWRVIITYIRLLWRFIRIKNIDIIIVGYPGQLDVILARLLSLLSHKPLVWDIFMSIYLISLERGLDKKNHFTVQAIKRLESLACRLPDLLILDTMEYVHWFHDLHGVPIERFKLVPTGADDRIFYPLSKPDCEQQAFLVVYYGTFIPNHGVVQIIEAARLLRENSLITFELIGDGPDRGTAQNLVDQYCLSNVKFIDWLDQIDLSMHIACADICLGVFGTTPQSLMTVQNKIYECLASAKTVISGDSPAVRQAFTFGKDIYLCERENPKALAQAILDLYHDEQLRNALAAHGYTTFREQYSTVQIGKRYLGHLTDLIDCI